MRIGILRTVPGLPTSGKLHFEDVPNTFVPLVYPNHPGDKLTTFAETLGFSVYIVAQTFDASNNANKVFPCLHRRTGLSASLTFKEDNWVATKTVTGANQEQVPWTLLTLGFEPPQ